MIGPSFRLVLESSAIRSFLWASFGSLALLAPASAQLAPPPAASAEMSFVRISVQVPLASLLERLEADLPLEAASSGFESYTTPEIERSRGFEVSYNLRRSTVTPTFDHDRIALASDVSYRLDVRGPEVGLAGCGQDKPIRIRTGSIVRVGWADDWTIACLARPEAMAFDVRCKPKPPGINFTTLLGEAVHTRFVAPLADSVAAGLARVTAIRTVAAAAWDALSDEKDLAAGQQLAWNPQEIRVDPIDVSGGVLRAEIGISVRPRIESGRASPAEGRELPPPNIRLFRDQVRIPLEFQVGWGRIGRSLRDSLAARARGRDVGIEVVDVRAHEGTGGSVVMELDVRGPLAGTWVLSANPAYDEVDFALEVEAVEFTKEARSRIEAASAENPAAGAALAELPRDIAEVFRFSVGDELIRQMQTLGRAVNSDYGNCAMSGGVAERRTIGVFASKQGLMVQIEAVGRAALALRP